MRTRFPGHLAHVGAIAWIALCSCLWPAPAQAQQILGTLTSADGLSDSRVFVVLQDHLGFMWFATRHGLNRYDGHTVTSYRSEAGDPSTLSGDIVEMLLEDSSGTLWVGTNSNGVSRFDRETQSFTQLRHDPDDPTSLSPGIVQRMFEDSRGFIWFGTSQGVSSFDPLTGRLSRHDQIPAVQGVTAFADAGALGVWIASVNGLVLFEPRTGQLNVFTHDPSDPLSLGPGIVSDLAIDRDGTLWIATGGGLNRWERDTQSFTRLRLDSVDESDSFDVRAVRLLVASDGLIWVGTRRRVHRFDPRDGSSQAFETRAPVDLRFGSSLVADILETPDNAIWVGSYGALFRAEPSGALSLYPGSVPDAEGLSDTRVRDLYLDRSGLLWVGTVGGVHRILPSVSQASNHVASRDGLASTDISHIEPDLSGGAWIATLDDTLYRLDDPSNSITRHWASGIRGQGARISALHTAPDGTLFVGSSSGLLLYDQATGSLESADDEPPSPRVVSLAAGNADHLWVGIEDAVRGFDRQTATFDPEATIPIEGEPLALQQGSDGSLWIATRQGLVHYVPGTGEVTRFRHDPNDSASLSHNRVNALLLDAAGALWVGTERSFLRHDPESGKFSRYFEYGDELDVPVFGIFEGDNDSLWIVTRDALWSFDISTEAAVRIGRADGVMPNIYGAHSVARNSSGNLYLGGTAGLTVYRPRDIESRTPPPVSIVDVRIARDDAPFEASSDGLSSFRTADIVLAHNDRLAVSFAVLDFAAPERHRFRYTLEGRDDGWTEVGADERQATFSPLPAGNYTFRVQGADHLGTWNTDGAALRLRVSPAWWNTTLFRLAGLTIILLIGAVAQTVRTRNLAQRNRTLEIERTARINAQEDLTRLSQRMINAQEEDRSRIARELHDDINQRLAALSIEMGVAKQAADNTNEGSGANLGDLQAEVERLSEDVRAVSHELHPATLERLGFAAALRALCRESSGHGASDVNLEVGESIGDNVSAQVALCLYRVAQEALRNIEQHAQAEQVEISLARENELVRMKISDNGRGFAVGESDPGLGLASMRERARLLDGTLEVHAEPGKGTVVVLRLPAEDATESR